MITRLAAAKFAALAAVLASAQSFARELPLALPDYPGVAASMDTQPCPATLPVTITGDSEAHFQDGRLVRKVMGWAQLMAEAECLDAAAIRLTAYVNGKAVYKAIALRADGWAMTEVRLEEPKPPIQASSSVPGSDPGNQSGAAAGGFAAIRECDDNGAHPDDPEAVARGVADDRVDANNVIRACEAALRIDKDTPRLRFQLARGYLKADRFEDAVEQLLPAAEQGHGGALAYLADLHLTGAPGIEADPALAHGLYQRALASGFTPAKSVLDQFEDWTDQHAAADAEEHRLLAQEQAVPTAPAAAAMKNYNNPKIVLAIQKGDLDGISYGELYTKAYLLHMAENIAAVCDAHFTRREVDELKNAVAMNEMDFSSTGQAALGMGILKGMAEMAQNPGAFMRGEMQANVEQKHMPEEAMKDAFKLMETQPCNSQGLERFSQNLRAYVTDKGAPVASADAMMNTCMREARPTGSYRGQQFCMCFLGAVKTNPVSRARRKALTSNFWPTAQTMMESNPSFGNCHIGIGR